MHAVIEPGEIVDLKDLERHALAALPPIARDYYASGSDDEITLRDNAAAYDRLRLWYRVLVDVSRRDLTTTVLGQPVRLPVLVAPTAFQRLAHRDGEVATARAAGAAGTIMILSTLSTTRVEDVTAAASGPVWFQLYIYKDRGATEALVRRVEAAGCSALVLTVDAPLLGRRVRDVRNRFALPAGLSIENMLAHDMGAVRAPGGDSGLASYFATLLDPALTWRDIEWLRSITRLPVVVKGLVRADDARRAVDHGASGVVVSNHGGRQLDTSPATIEALPAVVDAVGGAVDVMVDGGVRRGTDVVKALALGARAVLVGRPVLWGLAVGGEAGVTSALGILADEIDRALALCGVPRVAELDRDLVRPA